VNAETILSLDCEESRRSIRARLRVADQIVVGFVGSLRTWHGIDLLMESIPDVVKGLSDCHFLVVGTGEMERVFRSRVNELGLGSRVTLTGGLPHLDVFRHIAAMDVALMPNSNAYGSPMKVLEYMAMGKPTIAPRLEPLEEIISDGITGRLVQPGSKQALVDAILELAKDPEKRRMMGTHARQHVLANHTWLGNARQVVQLYERCVASSEVQRDLALT
jgi:glycosyltransferase involved in cell wall biosynthesis